MAVRKTKRDHYRKYFQVQERLVQCLEAGRSAKEAAKDLGISLPTFYKYKSIASIENDTIYMTAEETDYVAVLQEVAGACGQKVSKAVKRARRQE